MVRDMTEGHPLKRILAFSAPLLLGNLFQQFYSMADSIIVGQYIGVNAFAAVGSTGSINFLILGFVQGACMGFAIPVAQEFGAGDMRAMRRCVANAAYLSVLVAIAVTALTALFTRDILRWMQTPADIFEDAYSYIFIVFAGTGATVLYNLLASVLRALGDSRTPLIYLIISSCINVVLDIFFISGLGMGVGAAALATAISQFVSAFLCLIHLLRAKEEYRLQLNKIRFDSQMLWQIIQNGVPSGFQNSVIAIANVFVQTNINAFGKMAMAGCGSYSKIEGFAFLPVTCFTMALTTFVSQNLGAKQYDRAKKGARFGVLCSIIIAELIGVVIYTAAPVLIAAFNSEPDVVHYGVMQSRTIALFYFLLAFSHCIAAVLRGSGNEIGRAHV